MNFSPAATSDLASTLSRVLRLSAPQKAQLCAIVAAARPPFDVRHPEGLADSARAMERLHRRIRPLLRAEQRKRFAALIALLDAGMERRAAE